MGHPTSRTKRLDLRKNGRDHVITKKYKYQMSKTKLIEPLWQRNLKYQICLVLLAAITSVLSAQTTKPVSLSDQTPFTDNLVISTKAGDVNMTASIVFDESTNTIALKLQSERKLFVFWQDIKYRKAFHYKRLRTDRLSYNLTGNTADQFHRIPYFYKALPKPHRKKYTFHTWAETQGLKALGAPRNIVNDSLVQTYLMTDTAERISIRLRDILFIDEAKRKGASHYYAITYGADLNTEYRISIERNPCFGLDAQISAAQNARDAVIRSYEAFKTIYNNGVVNSAEGEQLFHELQDALQIQFPVNQDSSICPAIQSAHAQYNQYIDSIQALSVTLQLPVDERVLNVKIILANSRTIDNNVTRWLTTKDYFERADLAEQCRAIIADTKDMIIHNGARTKEEKEAVAVFKKAEQYFDRTCR